MKLHRLFRWAGSKLSSAEAYPEPLWNQIVEPFAGAAGYALNYPECEVDLWDNDPDLGVLWRWLINEATQSDVLAIPLKGEVPEGFDIRNLGLSHGAAQLLRHWQRLNNARPTWLTSPWSGWDANVRSRVAEEITVIKHWIFAPLTPADWRAPNATWFLDPPYLYNERYRTGKNFDYSAYAAQVQGIHRSCQIIACEAPCAKTGRVPSYLPFEFNHTPLNNRRGRRSELVYVRNPA